jgi:hypothetical protein
MRGKWDLQEGTSIESGPRTPSIPHGGGEWLRMIRESIAVKAFILRPRKIEGGCPRTQRWRLRMVPRAGLGRQKAEEAARGSQILTCAFSSWRMT